MIHTIAFLIMSIFPTMDVIPVKDGPIELGKVNWERNYETAIQQAESSEKPIFILFQEVPGCATCRNYGKNVLSHPLIVETIQNEFVPLAIYNNKRGDDAKILSKFGEPSWNNPVVRIIDAEEKQLSGRVAGNYSQLGVVDALISSLVKYGKEVPVYLSLLREELQSSNNQSEFAISMYCFWSGERELAGIKGVVSTEAGFMDGREVVKVVYDEDQTSVDDIYKQARKAKCADNVYLPDGTSQQVFKDAKQYSKYRKDPQTKYYLYNSDLKYVPMLPIQELKVNQALATRQDPTEFLSPNQLAFLDNLPSLNRKAKQNRIGSDFVQSWEEVQPKP